MTDTELLILVHASNQDQGHAWPFPDLKGNAELACDNLLRKKYLKRQATDAPRFYGTARGVGPFIPVITPEGCKFLNLIPEQRPI